MTLAVISLAAFLASLLTLFSGFGLGTLLMPVVAIFFPVAVAVALTAVVHLLNNLFKLAALRRDIEWPVALRFGVPSEEGDHQPDSAAGSGDAAGAGSADSGGHHLTIAGITAPAYNSH